MSNLFWRFRDEDDFNSMVLAYLFNFRATVSFLRFNFDRNSHILLGDAQTAGQQDDEESEVEGETEVGEE
jgi:hypothetical protein